MSRVRTEIEVDENLLHRVEDLAQKQGRHRDAVIEYALREEYGDITVDDVLPLVKARSDHSDVTNLAVAQAQSSAMRVSQEAHRAAWGHTGTDTREVDGDSGESGSFGSAR